MKLPLLLGMTLLAGCTSATQTLYVGTYGDAIHILDYNLRTGAMVERSSINSHNASYIALSNGGNAIFAVNESGAESGVSSFERNAGTWGNTGASAEVEFQWLSTEGCVPAPESFVYGNRKYNLKKNYD